MARTVKGQPVTAAPAIVGFSDALDPLWVELTLETEVWTGYIFRLHFAPVGELTGVDLRRSGQAPELTAHLLQRVPLGVLERTARRHIRAVLEPFIEGLSPESHARVRLQDIVAKERPTQRDAHGRAVMFARLALWYVDTLGRYDQMDVLAREFGYNISTIPKLVATARNSYHFLTPTKQGRSGGTVTSAAYVLLANHVIERQWAGLSDAERADEIARRAANKERSDDAASRYERGAITHAEWEQATFGQTFPRDEAGDIHLKFD